MMRYGSCTACGAQTVRAGRNAVQLGEHQQVMLRPHREPGTRGMFASHPTDGLWTFACTSCGYVELHLLDPGALAFVGQQWPAVPVQDPPSGPPS